MCDDPLGQDIPVECLLCGRKMPVGLSNICEFCAAQEEGPSSYSDPEWEEEDEEIPEDGPSCFDDEDQISDLDESMDGDFDSGMRDAGFGTDEDYGFASDVY